MAPKTKIKSDQAESPDISQQYKNMQDNADRSQLFPRRSGVNNTSRIEIVPIYSKTDAEYIIKNSNLNCSIVLGKDRPGGVGSGYGGSGFTGCSAIDIVAGRISSRPIESYEGKKVYISNNFELDAARVYVSQMTNVDDNLAIPTFEIEGIGAAAQSTTKNRTIGKSAVAIIGDHCRVLGRESIIMATRHFGLDSTGQTVQPSGISLIAGVDVPDVLHSPQPMVKGGNLLALLETTYQMLAELSDVLNAFIKDQSVLNNYLINHEHSLNLNLNRTNGKIGEIKAFTDQGKLLTNSVNNIIDALLKKTDVIGTYLTDGSDKYILSKWNRVN